MRTRKFLYGLLAGFPLAVLAGLIGCSGVTATQLDGRLPSNASADAHMAAAMLYQSKAQQLEAEADRYEATASKIGPYEDPKGFRRGGLTTAAQSKRGAAERMQELSAVHSEKAQTMYGMTKPE
ncbi:MAG: hypothetical protein KGO23_05990 [Nitrospirota bacterium]|nr:hypothetical protein [Nitrospirota bacterium]